MGVLYSMLLIFYHELLGTLLLTLLGCGVVANVALKKTNGSNGGYLLVTFGWGMAVFVGASVASASGAHLNPAVTLALASTHKVPFNYVPIYIIAQLLGAFLGAVLCWLVYKLQFDNDTESNKLGIFSTIPAIRNTTWNFITEAIGTFVLIIWILYTPSTRPTASGGIDFGNSALGYAAVMFVVIGIGASLGGPTGYAINPARDLGPRIAHAILPIKGKGSSDWNYSWVPILGPIAGSLIAVIFYNIFGQ